MRLDINSDEFDFLLRRILLVEVGFAEGKRPEQWSEGN